MFDKNYYTMFEFLEGSNIFVEIDKSKFGKNKYHREQTVKIVLIFGVAEQSPLRKFLLIISGNKTQ